MQKKKSETDSTIAFIVSTLYVLKFFTNNLVQGGNENVRVE
jgi:hypothetical protein